MKYPFLSLKQANSPYEDELKQAAVSVIDSGWYLHGKHTELLEQEIASLCQARHCIAVSNGLDALRLILRAYIELGRLNRGDKVIVPGNTFVASVLAISDNGLVPVLCDPDPVTMNLDSNCVERLITPEVKAIMPVHLYGTPCWDEKLKDLATQHNLLVIEDNAQAIGAQASVDGLNGTRTTGALGHAAGISFYPTKNLGALGDAGAVTTCDDDLARTVRALASYGSDRRYHNIYCGFNCRIDEIQAAMLRVKLRHLNEENARRDAIAQAYNEAITHAGVITPARFEGMKQVWHQYVIRVVTGRDDFRARLEQLGVGTDIHYATPPHCQPCYAGLEHGPLPVTEQLAGEVVSLPIAHSVTEDDARAIAAIINSL
ncbi:MAG: DegT/DnrJ/EryC1/StrS family aminotransferase [Bacteroidales bacterium]|nr:DegT/DnrJ/EryC1/StrS family aminotransferase [Candidatus Sodaliphilus limicaballi]